MATPPGYDQLPQRDRELIDAINTGQKPSSISGLLTYNAIRKKYPQYIFLPGSQPAPTPHAPAPNPHHPAPTANPHHPAPTSAHTPAPPTGVAVPGPGTGQPMGPNLLTQTQIVDGKPFLLPPIQTYSGSVKENGGRF